MPTPPRRRFSSGRKLAGISEDLTPWGLALDGSPVADKSRVTLELQMSGLTTAIPRWVAQSLKKDPGGASRDAEPAEPGE